MSILLQEYEEFPQSLIDEELELHNRHSTTSQADTQKVKMSEKNEEKS